jgi:hypothetical protein
MHSTESFGAHEFRSWGHSEAHEFGANTGNPQGLASRRACNSSTLVPNVMELDASCSVMALFSYRGVTTQRGRLRWVLQERPVVPYLLTISVWSIRAVAARTNPSPPFHLDSQMRTAKRIWSRSPSASTVNAPLHQTLVVLAWRWSSLPWTAAARAIPPHAASTSSPCRIGFRVDFHARLASPARSSWGRVYYGRGRDWPGFGRTDWNYCELRISLLFLFYGVFRTSTSLGEHWN